MSDSIAPVVRPRRLRGLHWREMLTRIELRRSDFILPVFVCQGAKVQREISAMPGIYQMSVDVACDWLEKRAAAGFKAYLIFGVIDRQVKDDQGSAALDEANIVCQLLREAKRRGIPMLGMTDLCFCEYTSHGHCGILSKDRSTVDNDATVRNLVTQAINHARAGADVIAPSGMMDGAVGAVRTGLDRAGYHDTSIMAYSVKYASAFYGPFREAAESAPEFGDRRTYQMDPARGADEAVAEALLDVEQGADLVMVKPAGPYLDVLRAVRQQVHVPVAAYQTSGEYAMLEAAGRNGWIDHDAAVLESLKAIKRAGADLIISYYGQWLERTLRP
jgi:porphobilinogen synthase